MQILVHRVDISHHIQRHFFCRKPRRLRSFPSDISTMATNAAIAAVVAAMIWLVGIGPFLLVHLPIMLLAASIGVWLFYIQHQFEHTVWAGDGAWNLREAALTAAPITPCRVLCAGSPPISAFTTSTTCAAASPIIDCRSCCATIRTSPASAGSLCFKVSGVCDWCCGTKTGNGSCRSAKRISTSDAPAVNKT